MTVPDRNAEIAIARAFHEANSKHGAYINAMPWDEIDIATRVMMTNAVNDLIVCGVIEPGVKVRGDQQD